MPQIKVEMVFDSIEEVRSFFGATPTAPPVTYHSIPESSVAQYVVPRAAPSTAAPAAFTPTVVPTVAQSAAPTPTASASSALTTSPDDPKVLADSVHVAMNDMIKKMPSGAGAAKAKEILLANGLARCRDVKDQGTASKLIAAFQAAA